MSADVPDLDLERLDQYLTNTLEVDQLETTIEANGLNLIIRVETTPEEPSYVLRRPSKLRRTELFAELSVEYRVLDSLDSTPVRTPEPVHFCENASILGEKFFLMSEIGGQSIPWGSDIPASLDRNEGRRHVGEMLIDGLADIHRLDATQFEGVCEHVTILDQLGRAESRLDEIAHVTGNEYQVLRAVGDRLREKTPRERRTLVHGDYKPDNVFFTDSPRPRIAGIVDWETVMLADPRIDLAYLLLLWRDSTDATPSLSGTRDQAPNTEVATYIDEVRREGFWPFTRREGSPNRRDLIDRYVETTERSFEDDRYFRAFAAYMLGLVWADLHRYEGEGDEKPAKSSYVTGMAMIASEILDGPAILD